MTKPRLELVGITKQYPGVLANSNVSLRIMPGEIHALLGENGAGKTTLIRILMGFLKPTGGSCTVCQRDPAREPLEIRRRVGYVSDTPALYSWMQVEEIGWFAAAFYDDAFLDRYRELTSRYDLPRARKIKQLSKGQRAKVALALALAHDPELLILDEPTTVLTPSEVDELGEILRRMADDGRSIIFISHKLHEVSGICDEATVLRQGETVAGSLDMATTAQDELARHMAGAAPAIAARPAAATPGKPLLELQNLSALGDRGIDAFSDVSF